MEACLQAVAQQGGRSVHSNIVSGKPPLNEQDPGKGGFVQQAIQADSGGVTLLTLPSAATGKILQQVGARMKGMDVPNGI